jgi:hypothetical protein
MANLSTPKKLSVPQLPAIRQNHFHTADAIEAIVSYINANVVPVQGTKVPTRKSINSGS